MSPPNEDPARHRGRRRNDAGQRRATQAFYHEQPVGGMPMDEIVFVELSRGAVEATPDVGVIEHGKGWSGGATLARFLRVPPHSSTARILIADVS